MDERDPNRCRALRSHIREFDRLLAALKHSYERERGNMLSLRARLSELRQRQADLQKVQMAAGAGSQAPGRIGAAAGVAEVALAVQLSAVEGQINALESQLRTAEQNFEGYLREHNRVTRDRDATGQEMSGLACVG